MREWGIEALLIAARVAVQRMSVCEGERVAVVFNARRRTVAEVLHLAALERGAESELVEFVPASRHGEEPPDSVGAAMAASDIVLAPTDFSISHTRARIAATGRGVRIATLPTITEEIFARAVPVDYSSLEADGDRLAALLTEAATCRITTEQGTDLVLDLERRSGRNDCGALGERSAFGNLPAGEAYIAPREVGCHGTIVYDGSFAGYGLLREPAHVEVRDGRLVAADGEAGRWLIETLDSGGPNGRFIAELGIGTNAAAVITGNILEDEKVSGTAHLAFGTSAGIGGTIEAGVHIDGVVRRPSVELDGRRVIEHGVRLDVQRPARARPRAASEKRSGDSESSSTTGSSPVISRATTSPVNGPSVTPSMPWPVATRTAGAPRRRPTYGSPSGEHGRRPHQ